MVSMTIVPLKRILPTRLAVKVGGHPLLPTNFLPLHVHPLVRPTIQWCVYPAVIRYVICNALVSKTSKSSSQVYCKA